MGGSDRRGRGHRRPRSLAAPSGRTRARIRSPRSRGELRRSRMRRACARLRRDREQLRALRSFAEPILAEMSDWPAAQTWGDWLRRARAARAARDRQAGARACACCSELAPLSAIGPVRLREVRDVLTPRLSTLTHEPPRRRHGRVFVGTPARRARPRVPGRVRSRPRRADVSAENPRGLAAARRSARTRPTPRLATQTARAADERLQLTLAVGAAAERLYVSFPRIELNESRPRVPSFYVLDILRAIEGRIPAAREIGDRALQAGGSTLAWPAPRDPAIAIDDFEHDLSTLGALLASRSAGEREGPRALLVRAEPRAAAIADLALAALASTAVGGRRRARPIVPTMTTAPRWPRSGWAPGRIR